MTKQALRRQILQRLRRHPESQRLAKSLAIGRALRRSALYRKAHVLLCYVSVAGEVETQPILLQALADGKRVAVPTVVQADHRIVAAEIRDVERDLSRIGPFGVREPGHSSRRLRPDELDLLIVPGVAFQLQGQRLGRGGGYFDRFLNSLPAAVPRVGLGFHFQLVKALPWEAHDQLVSALVTEKGIFHCRR